MPVRPEGTGAFPVASSESTMAARKRAQGAGGTTKNTTPLRKARGLMAEALTILDTASTSAAAATLDLAIHKLDQEIGA